SWSLGASTLVILLALLLWLGAAWLCYANWQRNAKRRVVAILETVRFILTTLLAFTLLRPEFVQKIQRSSKPEIAVLLDASASMNTRDIAGGSTMASRAAWLDAKSGARFWGPLEKSGRVIVEKFSAPP